MFVEANPDELRSLAQRFSAIALELRNKGNKIEELKNQLTFGTKAWQGEAASVFADRCDMLNRDAQKKSQVLEDATSVLNQLAIQMDVVKDLRNRSNQLESLSWECIGDSIDSMHRRQELSYQAESLRQEADSVAASADRQAALRFNELMDAITNLLDDILSNPTDASFLDSLPVSLRSYYARHRELVEEEEGLDGESKKRHVFLVGGIAPTIDPYDLAIANLGEKLVQYDEADSYTIMDEFTPKNALVGVAEVGAEKIGINRVKSDHIVQAIEEYHKEHPDEEIDIIAHSGGGELSENAQNKLYDSGEGNVVNQIISFGGADWTDPINKKIHHISSPYDLVGNGPVIMPHPTLYDLNDTLDPRKMKEQSIDLHEKDSKNIIKSTLDHVVFTTGDHVNYFTPGDNLDQSLKNVEEILSSPSKVVNIEEDDREKD